MQTKTKIIHLIGSLNPGGVQTYILNISNYDKIHKIRREVWTLYQKKGLLYTEFLKRNINVSSCQIIPADKNWRPYFLWKWLRYFASIFYFLRLYRKLKISKPDLVILDEPVRILTQFFVLRLSPKICKNFPHPNSLWIVLTMIFSRGKEFSCWFCIYGV